MKKRLLLVLPVLASLSLTAHAQFSLPSSVGGFKLPTKKTTTTTTTTTSVAGLTNTEAANGLKEALIQGISKGSDQASKTDGFNLNSLIRIPFPPDAQTMATTLRKIGLGSQVQSAKPIFINAIKSLSFTDVWNILTGQKDAATQYLKRTTTSQLTTAFMPIMQQSLDKVDATKYYSSLSTTYNKLPLVTPVQTDLNQYATSKAIDGLFTLIAQEEADIRENPVARTTSLLKKVFGIGGK
jgi:hypothetical protein